MTLFFDSYLINLSIIPALLVIIVLIQYFMSYSYWRSRNVPCIPPKFPFGNVALISNNKINSAEWFVEVYKVIRSLREKCMGLFIFNKPILVIIDPNMIEIILNDEKYFEKDEKFERIYFNIHFDGKWYRNNVNITQNELQNTIQILQTSLNIIIEPYVVDDIPLDMKEVFEKINSQQQSVCFNSIVCDIITYCLYELSKNQTMQCMLRNEIDTQLNNSKNITYDVIANLKYLEQIIYETLRIYPPVPLIKRILKEKYTFPYNNKTVIEKGIQIWIPILGLHNDIWYYSQPKIFNPQRFTEEENINRVPYTYLPFGDNFKISEDLNLILIQIKVSLIILLKLYTYSVNPIMELSSKLAKGGINLESKQRIYLQAKRTNDK